jgi:hypothetical protein
MEPNRKYFPWPGNFPEVASSHEVNDIMRHPAFMDAKHYGDLAAAGALVRDLHPAKRTVELGRFLAVSGVRLRVSVPTRQSGNVIPLAYAMAVGEQYGVPVDCTQKIGGASHTGKTMFERFMARPEYAADGVQGGARYVIVDDVFSQGGSVSEMRQMVMRAGGHVVGVTTLAYTGCTDRRRILGPKCIAMPPATVESMVKRFGDEELTRHYRDLGVYGGNWLCSTESEAWMVRGFAKVSDFRAAVESDQKRNIALAGAGKSEPKAVPAPTASGMMTVSDWERVWLSQEQDNKLPSGARQDAGAKGARI